MKYYKWLLWREEKCASGFLKDFTHHDFLSFFNCYVRAGVEATITDMVDDTQLVRGEDRESERKRGGGGEKTERAEMRREDQTSQQLSGEQGGGGGGAPGTVEELLAWLGQRRPEGTTTRILFAIVSGKERRMEE